MALALARCSLSLPHGCTGTRLSPRPAAPRAVRCCSAQSGRGSKRLGWLDGLRCGSGDGGGGGSSSDDVKPPGQQERFAYVQLLLGVVGTVLVVTGQVRCDRRMFLGSGVGWAAGWCKHGAQCTQATAAGTLL
jgi:hypothetical protein